MSEERLKIAVFIDFDNIEIGVKTTLGSSFDVGAVLEALKERGEVVTKSAYGDWTRAGDYGRAMSQHAIHMIQRNLTPGGDKNGADINLALDALEMAFTHNHINAFVIVGGDSDFISLVEKLKQYDRKVFVVGGRAFTSMVMQKNCTEFIAYENLIRRGGSRGGRQVPEAELSRALPLVRRALKLLADREVVPQLGLLKSTLLQLDSAFSEREYGASTFRDFVQKLAKAGFVTLKGSDRSFHVELREGREAEPAAAEAPPRTNGASTAAVPAQAAASAATSPTPPIDAPAEVAADPGDTMAEDGAPRLTPADGFAVIQQAFARATVARWPLYVRQVKQMLKSTDERFDERRFGFAGIIDALRHCHREGLFRLDRDRQGVVRVYPGVLLQRTDAPVETGDQPASEAPSAATVPESWSDTTSPADTPTAAPRLPLDAGSAVDQVPAERPRGTRQRTPRTPGAATVAPVSQATPDQAEQARATEPGAPAPAGGAPTTLKTTRRGKAPSGQSSTVGKSAGGRAAGPKKSPASDAPATKPAAATRRRTRARKPGDAGDA